MVTDILMDRDLMSFSYEELCRLLVPSYSKRTDKYCDQCGQWVSKTHHCYWRD